MFFGVFAGGLKNQKKWSDIIEETKDEQSAS